MFRLSQEKQFATLTGVLPKMETGGPSLTHPACLVGVRWNMIGHMTSTVFGSYSWTVGFGYSRGR